MTAIFKSVVKEGYSDMMTFEKHRNVMRRQSKALSLWRVSEVTQQAGQVGWRSKEGQEKGKAGSYRGLEDS